MKLHWMEDGIYSDDLTPILPESISGYIKREIDDAFNKQLLENPFIVNDTVWGVIKKGKFSARAVNEAGHISKRFQTGLVKLNQGWKIEHEMDGQTIDAFKEFHFKDIEVDRLDETAFRQHVFGLDHHPAYLRTVNTLYHYYYLRPFFLRAPGLKNVGFQSEKRSGVIKVGLEFETGNIASSFRALAKMRILHNRGQIDYGVFITSLSRKVSTGIWPPSNRNGSLEELESRKFLEDTPFPLLICGFEPDRWDKSVGYLNDEGRYFLEEGRPFVQKPTRAPAINLPARKAQRATTK